VVNIILTVVGAWLLTEYQALQYAIFEFRDSA